LSNAFIGHFTSLPWQNKKQPRKKKICIYIFFFFSVLKQIKKDSIEHHSQYKQGVMGMEKLGKRPSYFGSCLLVCCIRSVGTAARQKGNYSVAEAAT